MRALLSQTSFESALWSHVKGPLEANVSVTMFCKDDLLAHIVEIACKDELERFLALLTPTSERQIGARDGNDFVTADATIGYEFDGNLFEDNPDNELLLTVDGPAGESLASRSKFTQKASGEKRGQLRYHFGSIKRKVSSHLIPMYHRLHHEEPDQAARGRVLRKRGI